MVSVMVGGAFGFLLASSYPPSPRTYWVVNKDISPSNNTGGEWAVCNSGDKVLGGGYLVHDLSGYTVRNETELAGFHVTASYPLDLSAVYVAPPRQAWYVAWTWPSYANGTVPAIQVDVWAVCQR